MAELVTDCPRCKAARTTFDVPHSHLVGTEYGWARVAEAFSICRNCNQATVFVLRQSEPMYGEFVAQGVHKQGGNINAIVQVKTHVSLKDEAAIAPPEHLPDHIESAFREGATCMAVGCYNASASMYRLCVDLATWDWLPANGTDGLNAAIRRSLGLRLKWLFDTGRLPEALKDLSEAIKEDGNDGAHEGNLSEHDAADIEDFTVALLERLYTEPARLKLAKDRRDGRRAGP